MLFAIDLFGFVSAGCVFGVPQCSLSFTGSFVTVWSCVEDWVVFVVK